MADEFSGGLRGEFYHLILIWHPRPTFKSTKTMYEDRLLQNAAKSADKLMSWWRHQMKTFSALLAFYAENSPVPGEFCALRPVTRSFDVSFDLHLNKPLSKQSRGWWFETPSGSLWRQCNVIYRGKTQYIIHIFVYPSRNSSLSSDVFRDIIFFYYDLSSIIHRI